MMNANGVSGVPENPVDRAAWRLIWADLQPSEFKVGRAVLTRLRSSGEIRIGYSIAQAGEDAGVTEKTASRCLVRLHEAGVLLWDSRRGNRQHSEVAVAL